MPLIKNSINITDSFYVINSVLCVKKDDYDIKKKPTIVKQSDSSTKTTEKKSSRTKKNPEDNLGSVVAELDTDKIARDVDYTDLRKVIDSFIKDFDNDVSKLFKEHFILDICDEFDINIRELIETLMEHEPYVFTVAFVKKYIRPFVTSLKNDKVLYDNSRNIKYYKPIFDYL